METSSDNSVESKDGVQDKCDPYYTTGTYLRDKHQQVRTESGRVFHKWALDLVPIAQSARILDAGCGWGRFIWPLIDDYGIKPSNCVGADLSVGMLQTTLQEAIKRDKPIRLCACDIKALPFRSDRFDGALANHVLYHLSDIPLGARELARILKPNGWLLVTTNSDKVYVPVIELHYEALKILEVPFSPETDSTFSMENGASYLESLFSSVQTFYFEDETRYYEAADFLKLYLSTGRYRNLIGRDDIDAEVKRELPKTVERLVQQIIDNEGVLRAPTLMGAFVCQEPVKG